MSDYNESPALTDICLTWQSRLSLGKREWGSSAVVEQNWFPARSQSGSFPVPSWSDSPQGEKPASHLLSHGLSLPIRDVCILLEEYRNWSRSGSFPAPSWSDSPQAEKPASHLLSHVLFLPVRDLCIQSQSHSFQDPVITTQPQYKWINNTVNLDIFA